MTIDQLLNAYAQVAAQHGLPPMRAVRAATTAHPPESDPTPAWAQVRNGGPGQGWVQTPSEVIAWTENPPDLGAAPPLAAQWRAADGGGGHLLFDGRCWLVAQVRIDGDPDDASPRLLLDEPSHRANAKAPPGAQRLRHQRLWQHDAELGWQPASAWFLGFQMGAAQP